MYSDPEETFLEEYVVHAGNGEVRAVTQGHKHIHIYCWVTQVLGRHHPQILRYH